VGAPFFGASMIGFSQEGIPKNRVGSMGYEFFGMFGTVLAKSSPRPISSSEGGIKLDRKGFTLIEVLIGLVLLAIALLAIAGMQITAVRGNFFSHYLTQASYAAQDRLEFFGSLPIDDAQLHPGNHDDGPVTISGMVFNRNYTVNVIGDLRTISYTVLWNDGVNRNITLSRIRLQ
jgi:type IV pilus assembly protein PilV